MSKLYKERVNWIEPIIIAQRLIQTFGEPGLIWLDSDNSRNGRWVILAADPIESLCSRGFSNNPSASNPFELLRSIQSGHWTGWMSYEAAAWIEPKSPWKQDSMATLWMASHDPIIKFDLHKKEVWIEGVNRKRFLEVSKLIKDINLQKDGLKNHFGQNKQIHGIDKNAWHWITSQKEYAKKIISLKKYIEAGDIFQANLSICCKAEKSSNISPIDLFTKLRKFCPAPFAGIIVGKGEANGEAIISTSPERFLKITPTKEIETRPIKGTRPRNPDTKKDAELAADLITSLKDRAENIMIVDLLRNDLGKVCKFGTVDVTQLVGLESFSKVHHLTSVVQGKLDKNKTWVDALEACWPGGSITGAPKIRACKRLYELEPIARGPYCGSFLHLNWDGQFDSNILIRSLLIEKNYLRLHAGCGIVADSNPYNESEELIWKLMPLIEALQ